MCTKAPEARTTGLRACFWLACAVVISFLALVAIIVHSAMEDRNATVCRSRIAHIKGALDVYSITHGCLPPAYVTDEQGNRLHSWRALLMYPGGFLYDGPGEYDQTEPWDGPNNRRLLDDPFGEWFACPSDTQSQRLKRTSYVAVIGERTLWPGDKPLYFANLPPSAYSKILVIEIPDTDIPWMEPRDISIDEALALFSAPGGLRDSRHPGGLHYVLLGGTTALISSIKTVEEFRQMLELDDTERAIVEDEIAP